jgi:hypothetical protein
MAEMADIRLIYGRLRVQTVFCSILQGFAKYFKDSNSILQGFAKYFKDSNSILQGFAKQIKLKSNYFTTYKTN